MKKFVLIFAFILVSFVSMAKGIVTLDKFNTKIDECISIALSEELDYRTEGLIRPVVVLVENEERMTKNLAVAYIYYNKIDGKSNFTIDLEFTSYYKSNTYTVVYVEEDTAVVFKGTKSVNKIDYNFKKFFTEYCNEYLANSLPEGSYSLTII